MKNAHVIILLLLLPLLGCSKNDEQPPKDSDDSMYFPPNSGSDWETVAPSELGWNMSAVEPLKNFLIEKNTKSFIILVNGRIAMEEYFGDHTPTSTWQWNSAGKTLVSATTGIAQDEGLLNIDDKVSAYSGSGWTSAPAEKENLITVRNLLTMTSGLNDEYNLVTKANLTYLADAGTRWSYHNVFQKLMDVVSDAGNKDFEVYFNEKLKSKIGMDGSWNKGLIFTIYHSTTRSMARFGLLALNKGKWKEQQIISESFFTQSISTSQNINPAYGYLWWLNGKAEFMIPGGQTVYPGYLIPNAPANLYAAMGASDQRIYVIPDKKIVIIRMGNASDPVNPNFAVSGFDQALWEKLNNLIK